MERGVQNVGLHYAGPAPHKPSIHPALGPGSRRQARPL